MRATAERSPAAPAVSAPVHPLLRWTFYLFVFSIPFELPRSPFPVELPAVTCSLFLMATLLHPAACYRRIPGALWWFAAYVYLSAFAFVVTGGRYPVEVRNLLLMLLQVIWMCWAAANVLRDDRVARSALAVLVTAGALRAAIQLLGIGTTTSPGRVGPVRVTGLGQNADFLAGIWAVALVVALDLALARTPRWRRAFVAAAALLMAVTMMQTGSRGALVALVAGMLVYFVGRAAAGVRWRDVALGAGALAAVAGFTFASPIMRHRFALSLGEGNLAGRERMYPELLTMYVERPALGWGPIANKYELAGRLHDADRWHRIARREGLVTELGRDPRWLRRDAHNVFLEALTSAGTPGFVALAGGMLFSLVAAWRARHGPRGWLPLAVFAIVLTFNQSENRVTGKLEWLMLGYVLASAPARPGHGAQERFA